MSSLSPQTGLENKFFIKKKNCEKMISVSKKINKKNSTKECERKWGKRSKPMVSLLHSFDSIATSAIILLDPEKKN